MNIVSADQYFETGAGYAFDPSKIADAHHDCWRRFVVATHDRTVESVVILSGIPGSGKSTVARLLDQRDRVIVDNTNLSAWEVSPYLLHAEASGKRVVIARVTCASAVAFARQTHGVPKVGFDRMAAAPFAPMPWWPVVEGASGDELVARIIAAVGA